MKLPWWAWFPDRQRMLFSKLIFSKTMMLSRAPRRFWVPPHSRIFVLMERWLVFFSICDSRAWQHPQKLRKQNQALTVAEPHLPSASICAGATWWRYPPLWLDAEDISGTALQAATYIAQGDEDDRNPSLRYLTLLREGARAHTFGSF